MSQYTVDTEVNFYASLSFVRANKDEHYTLGELGFSQEDLEEMTDSEVEDCIEEEFERWLGNQLDSGWVIEED